MKYILNLLILIFLYFIGVLIFTSGFLLRRIVVNENNTCNLGGQNICLREKTFDKAIIVIIDALRYDFMTFNHSLDSQPLPYLNNFKDLHHLLKTEPANGRLYRFNADPPTTTLQRLKALTTGSLPTFVDAGSNFAHTEISEDNVIDQLLRFNKSITFMGDDTWIGLYPNRFEISYPYSSFNVKDLDSVDNGVIKHTMPHLERGDFDLLIAHLLGVDHCGHTFGPFHEQMRDKLAQMDAFIKLITEKMDNSSVLFVFGDHGMTRTGDHGGDSDDELAAGLFVYSKKALFSGASYEERSKTPVDIDQIDLVPTLSQLLSIPVPFQNLGLIITDIFHHCTDCDGIQDEEIKNKKALLNLLLHLSINAEQIKNYIETYLQVAGMDENLLKLNDNFIKVKFKYEQILREIGQNDSSVRLEDLEPLKDALQEYIRSVRKVLRRSWAQFDLHKMLIGLVITTSAFLLNVTFMMQNNSIFSNRLASIILLSESVLTLFVCFNFEELYLIILFVVFLIFIYFLFASYKGTSPFGTFSNAINFQTAFSLVIWITYTLSLLSNSYLVNESQVIQYFLKSTIFIQIFIFMRAYMRSSSHSFFKQASTQKPVSLFSNWNTIIMLIFTTCLATFISTLLNLSMLYYSCREEQVGCVDGWMVSDPSLNSGVHPRKRLLISSLSIFFVTVVVYKWLKSNGSLKGCRIASMIGAYIPFIIATCIVIYWCFSSILPPNQTSHHLTTLVQAIYFIFIISTTLLIIFPSTPHSIHKPSNQPSIHIPDINPHSNQIIPSIFHQLKSSWKPTNDQQTQPTIYIFGLSTSYSSSLIILVLNINLILSLLLGPDISSSLPILFAILILFFELHASLMRLFYKSDNNLMTAVPLTSITTLLFITSHHFYSLSHHPTITSIKWNAAFIGIHGDQVNNVLAAIMIIANTFASQIIGVTLSPLLLYWPYIRGRVVKIYGQHGKSGNNMNNNNMNNNNNNINHVKDVANDDRSDGDIKGEYSLKEVHGGIESPLFQLFLKLLMLLAFKMLGVMACVTIHRRHLMVWKIFAPRFIYEIVSFFVSNLFVVFTFAFSMSTEKAVERFINGLA